MLIRAVVQNSVFNKWQSGFQSEAWESEENNDHCRDSNYNTDVWLVDADNTDKGKNLVQLTTSPGADASPTWHPHGEFIAYTSASDVEGSNYATKHLAVIDLYGGESGLLTEDLDRNVSGLEFSEDGKYIYLNVEDSGENHIARIPARGG